MAWNDEQISAKDAPGRTADGVGLGDVAKRHPPEFFVELPPSLAPEGFLIHGLARQATGREIRHHTSEHQRQDDLVVECQLKDHHDCHDWSPCGGGEKGPHPEQGKRPRLDAEESANHLDNRPEEVSAREKSK